MGQTKEIMSIRADTRVGRHCNENIPPRLGEEAGHHMVQLSQAGCARAAVTRWARMHTWPMTNKYCRKLGCLTQYFSLGSCTCSYSHSKRRLGRVCIYNVHVAIAPGKGEAYSDHVFCNILAFTPYPCWVITSLPWHMQTLYFQKSKISGLLIYMCVSVYNCHVYAGAWKV